MLPIALWLGLCICPVHCYYLLCDYYIVLSFFSINGSKKHRRNYHDQTNGRLWNLRLSLRYKVKCLFTPWMIKSIPADLPLMSNRSRHRRACTYSPRIYSNNKMYIDAINTRPYKKSSAIYTILYILYYAIMYIHNVKHDDASSLFVIRANTHTHDIYVIM